MAEALTCRVAILDGQLSLHLGFDNRCKIVLELYSKGRIRNVLRPTDKANFVEYISSASSTLVDWIKL